MLHQDLLTGLVAATGMQGPTDHHSRLLSIKRELLALKFTILRLVSILRLQKLERKGQRSQGRGPTGSLFILILLWLKHIYFVVYWLFGCDLEGSILRYS